MLQLFKSNYELKITLLHSYFFRLFLFLCKSLYTFNAAIVSCVVIIFDKNLLKK